MINYTKRIVKYGKNKRLLVADFADPQYAILSHLLTSEVPMFYEDIMRCLDIVLTGQEAVHEFSGNSCLVCASKAETKIECTIDGAEIGEACIISTEELKSMVQLWKKDLSVFRAQK